MMEKLDILNEAIARQQVFTVTTHSYLGDERRFVDRVLDRYLTELGLSSLMNNIGYCIHEVAGNAHKANLKRLYFEMEGLDITKPEDYERGMRNFREDVLQNPHKYTRHHKAWGYYIKLHFQIQDSFLKIVVRNNVPLTDQEKIRIAKRERIAESAGSLAEVYSVSEDYTEGSGLGLVMLHLILRKLGFSASPFRIFSRDGETIAFLKIDMKDAADIEERHPRLIAVPVW
jgi:hypothetical protein